MRNYQDGSELTQVSKAIGTGLWAALLGFLLSLPLTIFWSDRHFAGEAQAPLAGMIVSFYLALAAGTLGVIFPILLRAPRIRAYVDYGCAWIILITGVVSIVTIELRHPPHAVLDTPILWIFLAMFNLLRLRNPGGVRSLRMFCIGANVAGLVIEAARTAMFGLDWLSYCVIVPLLLETLFSIARPHARPFVIVDKS
jgi:hypothetical protein